MSLDFRRPCVLLTAQEGSNRAVTADVLQRSGLSVVDADSGQQALARLDPLPDVVLIVVPLPDYDPGELCQRIRQRSGPVWVPVLLLCEAGTEFARQGDDGQGGPDGVLSQPLEGSALVTPVRALVRAGAERAARLRAEADLRKAEEERAQREQSEAAVRASEAHLRALVEAEPDCVKLLDADGMVLQMNAAGLSMIEASSCDEVVGRSITRFIVPEQRERFRAYHEQVCAGASASVELEIVGLQGTHRWVECHSVPLQAPDGTCCHLAVSHDVTPLRKATRELAESESRLRAVFDAAPIGIAYGDLNGRLLGTNRALQSLLGYSEEELLGKPAGELFHPEEISRTEQLYAEVLQGVRTHYQVEVRLSTRGGRELTGRLTGSLVRDAQGQPLYSVGMVEDVSERVLLEQQLQQSQKMEAIGRLAGGIAHDFNNMLAVINGYTELLLNLVTTGRDPRLQAPLQEIRRAGERAASLTRQLLAFSRKQLLELRVLDLRDLVLEMEGMLRPLIGEDIELKFVTSDHPCPVKVDRGQIQQVLLNFIVNSRDAMPTGGQITIEVLSTQVGAPPTQAPDSGQSGISAPYVLLAVTDNGCGMPPEVMEHVFEPFFTTKEVGQGTGLGLATVFGIVQQSGGHIQVQSEVGQGSTFRVFLPRTEEEATKAAGTPSFPMSGNETVLLVEDEEMVRNLVRNILEMYGYRVLCAANGAEAVQLAEKHRGRLDLLLCDVVMPGGMGGVAVAEHLRRERPDLRVLFMSGYTDDAIVRHGLVEAETEFLQKPFTPLALARKVRTVLG